MTGQRVARRYARALVELAQEAGRVDETGAEVEGIAGLFGTSGDLRNLMFSPGIAKGVKRNVLAALTDRGGVSDLTRRFLNLLLDKDRIRHIAAVSAAYREMADELNNRIRAKIRSAFALSPDEEAALRRQLSSATGKDVVLEVETDQALLGGLKAQLGSSIWDGSVRKQLESLRDRLVGSP